MKIYDIISFALPYTISYFLIYFAFFFFSLHARVHEFTNIVRRAYVARWLHAFFGEFIDTVVNERSLFNSPTFGLVIL